MIPAEAIGRLLRGQGDCAPGSARTPWLRLAGIALACGGAYGLVLGGFSLRPLQCLFSALKVPLLLGCSAALCLPPLCALNLSLGLGRDLGRVLRAGASGLAALAVCLAALAPFSALTYLSSANYRLAIVVNGLLFALATLGGQSVVNRHYAALVSADPRHRLARRSVGLLFAFVGIQMSWILRPFVGAPGLDPQFVRPALWDNAYVIVARTTWELFSGR